MLTEVDPSNAVRGPGAAAVRHGQRAQWADELISQLHASELLALGDGAIDHGARRLHVEVSGDGLLEDGTATLRGKTDLLLVHLLHPLDDDSAARHPRRGSECGAQATRPAGNRRTVTA